MSIDITSRDTVGRQRSSPQVSTVARVDLRVGEVRAHGGYTGADGTSAVFTTALGNIERTVRSDDRVCPFGLTHIAVAFGPDADAVTPRMLGERLARAVSQGHVDDQPGPWAAAPGHDGAEPGTPPRVVAVPSTTVVTVDRLLDEWAGAGSGRGTEVPSLQGPALRHRTVVRYSTARLNGYGTRHDDHPVPADDPGRLGTVLVVDPGPSRIGTPGLTAQAASALAGRLGFTSAVLAHITDDPLVADIDGTPLDLVVLVVGAEPTDGRASWATSTWCVPARLTSVYRSMGVDVLAVSSGATAGAMVGCIEQGAAVLFDINALSGALLSRSRLGEAGPPWPPVGRAAELSAPLRSLLRLTSSERRVLFYLTSGLAAQEIAEELVVSLATVRSHIRSILRKLDVRSQLAAVAVANSCGPVQDRTSHAS